MSAEPAHDVDEYIAAAPAAARPRLEELRAAIRAEAPQAEERISYGMPSYHLNGRLAYFSLHAKHIGLYPGNREDADASGLGRYMAAKSTLQLPLSEPLPIEGIRRFIRRRVERAAANAGA